MIERSMLTKVSQYTNKLVVLKVILLDLSSQVFYNNWLMSCSLIKARGCRLAGQYMARWALELTNQITTKTVSLHAF